MLNIIWLGMMVLAVIVAIFQGRLDQVVHAVTESAQLSFQFALGLAAIMALWLGIMEIATQSGVIDKLSRWLRPVMRWLFPDVPVRDPAMGAMILNIAANMLGLGNAATPFGLEAMKELQRLNKNLNVASDAMCTFLAINTSSVQLIPITAITYLAANGSAQPSSVILSSLIATSISTIVAIVAVKNFSKWRFFKRDASEL